MPLSGTGDPGDRPTPPVSGQVNLARQPAPGPADRFPARPARAARRLPTGGSGSSPDFLSFDPPPCVQLGRRDDLRGDVGGRLVAGTGGVLMGADHTAVHPDRPVRASASRRRGATPRGSQPGCRRLTSGDAGCRRSSSARTRRHVPPRDTTTGPPEHPVEHRAVIRPPATATRVLVGQQRFQPSPFRIGQIMSMQHPARVYRIQLSRSAGHAPAGLTPQPAETCGWGLRSGSCRDTVCRPVMNRRWRLVASGRPSTGAGYDATAHRRRCPVAIMWCSRWSRSTGCT